MNNSNKLLWVVIILTVVMVVVGLGSKFVVDKVADRVIQKLQKEYSPSPYGPGIDPDKLDVEKMKRSGVPPLKVSQPLPAAAKNDVDGNATWEANWEKQRK